MSRLYTALASACLIGSAFTVAAAPAGGARYPELLPESYRTTSAGRQAMAHGPRLNMPAAPRVSRVAPAGAQVRKKAAPSAADIISNRPEGTSQMYTVSSTGYYVFWGYIFPSETKGAAIEIITGTDGKSYMSTPITSVAMGTWIECSVSDDKVIVKGGQPVFDNSYENGDEMVDEVYTLDACAYTVYEEDGETYEDYVVTGSNEYVFNVSADGVLTPEDPELLLGLCWDMPVSETETERVWIGYGDYDYVFEPFNETVKTFPEGAEPEQWACIQGEGGHFASVYVDNESGKVYVGNLLSGYSAVIEGELSADGKSVSFPESSYMGVSYGLHCFLHPAVAEEVYDDYYEEYYTDFFPLDEPLTFSYDAETKTMVSESAIAVTNSDLTDEASWYVVSALESAKLQLQNRKPGTPPAAPNDLAEEPGGDYPYVKFNLPQLDVDGNLLDTSRMYYNVFVDGDVFVFYPDEYIKLEEELENVPYDFNDEWDIIGGSVSHTVYTYWKYIDTWGVRQFYVEDDGSVTASELVEVNSNAAVKALDSVQDGRAVYYNVNGLRVDNPGKGLYIKRVTNADGSVRTVKTVR